MKKNNFSDRDRLSLLTPFLTTSCEKAGYTVTKSENWFEALMSVPTQSSLQSGFKLELSNKPEGSPVHVEAFLRLNDLTILTFRRKVQVTDIVLEFRTLRELAFAKAPVITFHPFFIQSLGSHEQAIKSAVLSVKSQTNIGAVNPV